MGSANRQVVNKDDLMAEFFLKTTSSIIGPGDTIVLPRISKLVDFECELCAVIGYELGELEAEDEETVGPIRASGQTEILLRDVYVMLGYETDPGRRIRLSYLAGAVVRQRRIEREATITTQPPIIPPLPIIPPIRRFEESIVSYETSLALGLDAAAMMTERLALVPQVRVVAAGAAEAQVAWIDPHGSRRRAHHQAHHPTAQLTRHPQLEHRRD